MSNKGNKVKDVDERMLKEKGCERKMDGKC